MELIDLVQVLDSSTTVLVLAYFGNRLLVQAEAVVAAVAIVVNRLVDIIEERESGTDDDDKPV